jgi:hypothetical protein
MGPWTGAQGTFALNAFYKNCDSLVIAQTLFRNFEGDGSTLTTKGGSVKTVRTPDNIEVVREAIERSQHRSARRHSCVTRAV